ncbi:monooxygenase [Actinomycetes bacterium KLBMP 9797]
MDELVIGLYVWRVPWWGVPRALVRLATDARRLRATPGVRFAKLLGTAAGFRPTDTDLTRYAAVVVSDRPVAYREGASTRLDLRLIHSRGRWAGTEPFGAPSATPSDGPILALTRARLRARKAVTFWRAVPPVAHAADGRTLAAFGIGEAPIGWQGTVSVWRNATDLAAFAYRHPEHRAAIIRTSTEGWYAEELFARFAVLDVVGDRSVLGWSEGGRGRA